MRQKRGRDFSVSEHMIFGIDFPDKTGFQKRNVPFFAHRYPLPGKPEFFHKPVMLTHGYITIPPFSLM